MARRSLLYDSIPIRSNPSFTQTIVTFVQFSYQLNNLFSSGASHRRFILFSCPQHPLTSPPLCPSLLHHCCSIAPCILQMHKSKIFGAYGMASEAQNNSISSRTASTRSTATTEPEQTQREAAVARMPGLRHIHSLQQ